MKMQPNNLFTMSNTEIMDKLRGTIIEDIPRGIKTEEDLRRLEYLLGKLANDYVYLISMTNYARNYVRQLKRKGKEYQVEYEDMMDKRDTLESIASAVKLQYQSVSRMLTIKIELEEENRMHDYRNSNQ